MDKYEYRIGLELHRLHFVEDVDGWIIRDKRSNSRIFYNVSWAQRQGFCLCGHEGWLTSGPVSERAKLHANAAFSLADVLTKCPSYQDQLKAPFIHAVKKLAREVRLKKAAPIWVYFDRRHHDFSASEGEEEREKEQERESAASHMMSESAADSESLPCSDSETTSYASPTEVSGDSFKWPEAETEIEAADFESAPNSNLWKTTVAGSSERLISPAREGKQALVASTAQSSHV